jgi:hypothetical protein
MDDWSLTYPFDVASDNLPSAEFVGLVVEKRAAAAPLFHMARGEWSTLLYWWNCLYLRGRYLAQEDPRQDDGSLFLLTLLGATGRLPGGGTVQDREPSNAHDGMPDEGTRLITRNMKLWLQETRTAEDRARARKALRRLSMLHAVGSMIVYGAEPAIRAVVPILPWQRYLLACLGRIHATSPDMSPAAKRGWKELWHTFEQHAYEYLDYRADWREDDYVAPMSPSLAPLRCLTADDAARRATAQRQGTATGVGRRGADSHPRDSTGRPTNDPTAHAALRRRGAPLRRAVAEVPEVLQAVRQENELVAGFLEDVLKANYQQRAPGRVRASEGDRVKEVASRPQYGWKERKGYKVQGQGQDLVRFHLLARRMGRRRRRPRVHVESVGEIRQPRPGLPPPPSGH